MKKACAALVEEPPVPVTQASLREMKAKHPDNSDRPNEAARARMPRQTHTAPAWTVEETDKTIRSFPAGSAAGPSALRLQHLKDALIPGLREEILRKTAKLMEVLAAGKAPQLAKPRIAGASLNALLKPNGALRPVAVGEVWRRMVGKLLLRTVGEDVTRYLEPTQVGVGTKGGSEAVIHTLRAWLARSKIHNDRVIAVTDLTNALNCIDRSVFRAQARRITLAAVSLGGLLL